MKKNTWNVLFVLLGLLAAAAGLWLLRGGADLGAVRALPYLCIGVGCGLFGQGAGELLAARVPLDGPGRQEGPGAAKKAGSGARRRAQPGHCRPGQGQGL